MTVADSSASAKGWPCIVLSDILVVHSYLGTNSFDNKSSLAVGDIRIAAPNPSAIAPAPAGDVEAAQKASLIEQCHQRTGMNAAFSEMCLAQNGWNLDAAVANFESIRATIPPEAFV